MYNFFFFLYSSYNFSFNKTIVQCINVDNAINSFVRNVKKKFKYLIFGFCEILIN